VKGSTNTESLYFLFGVLIATPSLIVLYHNYLNFVRAVFLI